MMRSCFAGVALIALLSAACSNDRAADRTSSAPGEGGGASGAASPPSATAETRLAEADQRFVQKAAQANQLEVELARMGQDKAQNEQLKDYARQLDQDHSEALNDLRQMAIRASVELEPQDDAVKTSMTEKLSNATGRQFDAQFLSQMIDDHRKDIAAFEQQLTSATGDLKAFIDKTLPVMREHLQKAEELQKRLGSTTNRG